MHSARSEDTVDGPIVKIRPSHARDSASSMAQTPGHLSPVTVHFPKSAAALDPARAAPLSSADGAASGVRGDSSAMRSLLPGTGDATGVFASFAAGSGSLAGTSDGALAAAGATRSAGIEGGTQSANTAAKKPVQSNSARHARIISSLCFLEIEPAD